MTTGAEATENAIKIARASTGRSAVIAFRHSFHGRTLMGMTLTGKAQPYRQNFGPFAPEVYHAPYPYEYWGISAKAALEGLQELFDTEVSPERVAALILEPQLGEGGFVPAPTEFLRSLRALTQKHGIVLIDDEIQSGIGRTGKFWAIEHAGIEPDLITFAKSIGGGLPIAGVLGRAEILDSPHVGGVGSTYGGNPLACVAALKALEILQSPGFLEHAQHIERIVRETFEPIKSEVVALGDVRGVGAMMALEFVKDKDSKEPWSDFAMNTIKAASQNGVILIRAGLYTNCIRFLPALDIPQDMLREALGVVANAIRTTHQAMAATA